MDFKKTSLLIVLLSYFVSPAQVMNVRKWRLSERDSLNKGMELFDEKFFVQALPIFENLLKQHPNEEFLKYTYAKCALYRTDKQPEAYKYFSEVYEKNKKTPDIQYDMALACHYNYKFDEALEYANQQLKRSSGEAKKNAETLIRYINNAKYFFSKPTPARILNLGENINSADDEYVPAITADESKLIFTYAGAKSLGGKQADGNYLEDIYMSVNENGEFKTATPLDSLNSIGPDAAVSLSGDGQTLFLYRDEGDSHGDLYQSVLIGSNYSKPTKLRGEVNSYSWDGHCSLSPDGQTLYFSSERAGGYGGRDIYKATLQADSTWGMVVNLGDSVNTAEDEDAPFIHADGTTLFYSSKGKSSMGGYDVFRAVMRPDDSSFKHVENLGYPINSPFDDIYFVLAANGKNGYYSSGKKDGYGLKDIYRVETSFAEFKPLVCLVKGKVKMDGVPVAAAMKVEISSKNNKLYKKFRSNASSGEYMVTLPPGVNYAITYSYEGKEETFNVDAVDLTAYSEKVHDVNFVSPVVAAVTKTANALAAKTASQTTKEINTLAAVTPKAETPVKTEPVKAESVKPVVAKAEPTKTEEPPKEIAKNEPLKQEPAKMEEPKTEPVKTEPVKEAVATEEPAKEIARNEPAKQEPVIEKAKPVETKPAVEETVTALGSTKLAIAEPKSMQGRNASANSAVDFTARPVTSTPLPAEYANATYNLPNKENFKPVNGPQVKSMRFAEKYNTASAPDVEFLVQVAAIKNDKNVILPNQNVLGKVEKLDLNDGYIRIVVGGAFKTVGEALAHNKKVVNAGQKEGFIIVIYKGQRVTYDELEKAGVLKKK